MEPICLLTRQDTEFNWTEEQENAFREMKRLVTTVPVFENINAAAFLPVSTSRLREIQQATEDDEILQALKIIILRGWTDDSGQQPEQTTPYFSVRDELSVHDCVIFRGQRIVFLSAYEKT